MLLEQWQSTTTKANQQFAYMYAVASLAHMSVTLGGGKTEMLGVGLFQIRRLELLRSIRLPLLFNVRMIFSTDQIHLLFISSHPKGKPKSKLCIHPGRILWHSPSGGITGKPHH